MNLVTVLCLAGTAPAMLAAADVTYAGKWKLNPAKSQLTGEVVSIEKTANGMLRFSKGDFSYVVNIDGKEYPLPGGGTTSWKQVDANDWEITNRLSGNSVVVKVQVKGDTRVSTTTIHKADGGTVEQSGVSTRISGGPGLLGKWKSSEVKAGATVFEIASDGADGITIGDPTEGIVCKARFDGKDSPCTGATYMLSFKSTGLRSFQLTTKLDGKPVYIDTYTVSADGKTLTDDGTPITVKEPTRAVYDRQ